MTTLDLSRRGPVIQHYDIAVAKGKFGLIFNLVFDSTEMVPFLLSFGGQRHGFAIGWVRRDV